MENDSIIVLKAGSLEKEVITLQSKDQEEALYYAFSLEKRIGKQTIKSVSWTSIADDIDVSNITTDKQTFQCLISGGTNYQNVGITFKVITSAGETRTFNSVLPIRPAGIMEAVGNNTVIVLGNSQEGARIEDISITPTGFNFKTTDGKSLDVVPEGIYIENGNMVVPEKIGKLPDDFVLNGNIYIAPDAYLTGTKTLPQGLSLNSNIVMTNGSVFFPKTINNNGLLCAA
ncbi:hypothetical protein CIN_09400 [Commensalibacter intestini A911]|uniref:Uncharacterized protein n=2 Tax=Commensalibacter intestini TaxID=479936 RepID=A0A251ZSZ7_9PROT|nr:hypothetical protein [Commensalibacter intestini]EHD14076.1 hypothetical protein CIN_09400 [Commensalibacter intestini A911]OUI77783.1 hypothetical protein HK18_01180 [Commensalibacter intestini]